MFETTAPNKIIDGNFDKKTGKITFNVRNRTQQEKNDFQENIHKNRIDYMMESSYLSKSRELPKEFLNTILNVKRLE